MSVLTVVCGNPRAKSRTLEAATLVGTRLRDGLPPDHVYDLADFGAALLTWGEPTVAAAVETVCRSDVVVVASPTYKGSYTGLLKLFLDQFNADQMGGAITFPVMLGGAMGHALAPEAFLKPVLSEIGASCPVRGLYLLDSDYTNETVLGPWLERARRYLR